MAGRPDNDGEFTREFLASIGAQLRAERRQRQLTLQQVASSAGLTKGFLSQLERGESSVSIASLLGLCAVLGIDIATLIQRATPAPAASPIVRRHERERLYLGGSGVEDYLLSPPSERRFEVFETYLEPLGSPSDQLYAIDAEVGFCCVLKGSVEIAFGDVTHRLHAGDSLTYSPRLPHTFVNPSSTRRAVVLFVNVPAVF
ncbi:MAG: helix-turn-helix domain-containing protein [Thermoleophilia bacterium]